MTLFRPFRALLIASLVALPVVGCASVDAPAPGAEPSCGYHTEKMSRNPRDKFYKIVKDDCSKSSGEGRDASSSTP